MMRFILLAIFLVFAPATSSALNTGRIFVSNEKSHDIYVYDADFNLIKQIENNRSTIATKLSSLGRGDITVLRTQRTCLSTQRGCLSAQRRGPVVKLREIAVYLVSYRA